MPGIEKLPIEETLEDSPQVTKLLFQAPALMLTLATGSARLAVFVGSGLFLFFFCFYENSLALSFHPHVPRSPPTTIPLNPEPAGTDVDG